MIPRLQRFYGGRIMDWFRLSMPVLRAYMEMLPKLKAEETMDTITAVAAGTGSLKRECIMSILKDLDQKIGNTTPVESMSPDQAKAQLLAMGIQYVEE